MIFTSSPTRPPMHPMFIFCHIFHLTYHFVNHSPLKTQAYKRPLPINISFLMTATPIVLMCLACLAIIYIWQLPREIVNPNLAPLTPQQYRADPEVHYRQNKIRLADEEHRECNAMDHRCYPVAREFAATTHESASELLAHANLFTIALLRHLRQKYLFNTQASTSPYKQKIVTRLLHNYNPDNYVENNPPTDENTSYVEDKGEVFGVCLREKVTGRGEFHSKHLIEFVVLHEISHLASIAYDHGDEFWTNFKILMEEAKEAALHEPVDYSKSPVNYCSLIVDYNPYFDYTVNTAI